MSDKSKVIIIIPARYDSTRFPGKPLAEIIGKPMLYHVYNRSKMAKGIDYVIVATDDKRIQEAVEAFGGKVVLTSKEHRSGSDRIAEVARSLDADIIVNVQGDEPLIEPKAIEQAIKPFQEDENIQITTLMKKTDDQREWNDPNVVKVVVDNDGFALRFSRSLIPQPQGSAVYKHIGLYAYRRDILIQLSELEQTPSEKAESLEQLRALENCIEIKVVETEYDSISVDTPDDLEIIKQIINTKDCDTCD